MTPEDRAAALIEHERGMFLPIGDTTTLRDGIAAAIRDGEYETAAGVWESVISLCASGTPIDGLREIARQNVEYLRRAKPDAHTIPSHRSPE